MAKRFVRPVPSVFLGDHDVLDKIADELDLIDIVIKQFNAGRFFDRDHQLKSLQPIKSEILHEVRLIRDAGGIDPQLIRDERADAADADSSDTPDQSYWR